MSKSSKSLWDAMEAKLREGVDPLDDDALVTAVLASDEGEARALVAIDQLLREAGKELSASALEASRASSLADSLDLSLADSLEMDDDLDMLEGPTWEDDAPDFLGGTPSLDAPEPEARPALRVVQAPELQEDRRESTLARQPKRPRAYWGALAVAAAATLGVFAWSSQSDRLEYAAAPSAAEAAQGAFPMEEASPMEEPAFGGLRGDRRGGGGPTDPGSGYVALDDVASAPAPEPPAAFDSEQELSEGRSMRDGLGGLEQQRRRPRSRFAAPQEVRRIQRTGGAAADTPSAPPEIAASEAAAPAASASTPRRVIAEWANEDAIEAAVERCGVEAADVEVGLDAEGQVESVRVLSAQPSTTRACVEAAVRRTVSAESALMARRSSAMAEVRRVQIRAVN